MIGLLIGGTALLISTTRTGTTSAFTLLPTSSTLQRFPAKNSAPYSSPLLKAGGFEWAPSNEVIPHHRHDRPPNRWYRTPHFHNKNRYNFSIYSPSPLINTSKISRQKFCPLFLTAP